MKTSLIYLDDPYIRELSAKVIEIREGAILDRTIFYASSGGQPADLGFMAGKDKYNVVDVIKEDEIIHKTEPLPEVGETVKLAIDWERRYSHMRQHTAIHVVSSIAMKEFNARITGNQIYDSYSRIDFNFPEWDNKLAEAIQSRANEELKKNHPVTWFKMKREEILGVEGSLKVRADLLPPDEVLRVVKIGDIDMQPDGGTHVRNTSEVGQIDIYKIENKGKNNKRMYFSLHM
jgi:Ser-tRNA(Ala) deacylase AlaX